MITGFVGLPGSGKTYYATKTALEYLKKGKKVYSNYEIVGAYKYNSLLDVLDIRDGLIIVDEINLLCPARFWKSFPPLLLYFWSQTRKFGLDIIWTAQAFSRVDTVVREITYTIKDFKKFIKPFHRYGEWIPEEMGKAKAKAIGSKLFMISSRVYNSFNTYELVKIPPEVLAAINREMGNFGGDRYRKPILRLVEKLSHVYKPSEKPPKSFYKNFWGFLKKLFGLSIGKKKDSYPPIDKNLPF